MAWVNLLDQTIQIIEFHGHTLSDVKWVGNWDGDYSIEWDAFTKISDIEYNPGYGGVEIALDLVVVGSDWWLERSGYDGSEWWNYKTLPVRRENAKPFHTVEGNIE